MNEKPETLEEVPPSNHETRSRRKFLRTEELFGGSMEIILLHADEEYRLRVTRNGKLILTK
jgi:hemin uptake protein HemP